MPAKKTSAKASSTSKSKKATPAKAAARKAAPKAAAKKAAAKKAAPKKAAAKKAAAKKAAPKKAAAKKAVATKAVAKKTASSKAASPKPKASKPASKARRAAGTPRRLVAEPTKKPGARKSRQTVSKVPDKQPASSKSSAKKKSPFNVGDKVVYPHHGAATIVKKERIEFAGEKVEYFVLEVATDQLIVRVPVLRALDLGVRPVISKNMARKVFATFRDDPQEAGSNWSRWYKLLTEKINSGDIFQVAEVVRDLTYAQQIKGISPALKRMLAKARLIIISELRFALHLEEEDAIRRLDRALPHVEQPVEA